MNIHHIHKNLSGEPFLISFDSFHLFYLGQIAAGVASGLDTLD
mgnify:CR=1 FL=1